MKGIKSPADREKAYQRLCYLYKYETKPAKIEFANLFFAITEYDGGREPEPKNWKQPSNHE